MASNQAWMPFEMLLESVQGDQGELTGLGYKEVRLNDGMVPSAVGRSEAEF